MMNAPLPDLSGEHRSEPVPPEPHRLVADIDTTLEQQVLDLAQRQRIADVQHHCEADNFWRAVEIAEGIFHPLRLGNSPYWLKPIYSDNAAASVRAVFFGADPGAAIPGACDPPSATSTPPAGGTT